MALIAEENIDIDNSVNHSDEKIAIPSIIEEDPESENAQDKAAILARNLEEQRRHENEENAVINVWRYETRGNGQEHQVHVVSDYGHQRQKSLPRNALSSKFFGFFFREFLNLA